MTLNEAAHPRRNPRHPPPAARQRQAARAQDRADMDGHQARGRAISPRVSAVSVRVLVACESQASSAMRSSRAATTP